MKQTQIPPVNQNLSRLQAELLVLKNQERELQRSQMRLSMLGQFQQRGVTHATLSAGFKR